jgi:hypothetical protein
MWRLALPLFKLGINSKKIEYDRNKAVKKILSVILICCILFGCSKKNANEAVVNVNETENNLTFADMCEKIDYLTSLVETQRTERKGISIVVALPFLISILPFLCRLANSSFIKHFINMVRNFFVNKLLPNKPAGKDKYLGNPRHINPDLGN